MSLSDDAGVASPERLEPRVAQSAGRRRSLASLLARRATWGIGTVVRFVVLWAGGSLLLGLIIAIAPGLGAIGPLDVMAATVVLAVVTAVVRPLIGAIAMLLGWVGTLVVAVLGQPLILYVGLLLSPGIEVRDFGDAWIAAWIYVLVMTLLVWLTSVGDQAATLGYVMAPGVPGWRSRPSVLAEPEVEGAVIVQLDGVPWPVLQLLVNSGDLPTLSRWVRSGSHTMGSWRARVPCTTPVSQAGILHGTTEDMPAFRWYEKATGRLLVANRPDDAAEIERRFPSGGGLLVDDGASIGNLFTGGAAHTMMTMSEMVRGGAGIGPSRDYTMFFLHPFGFARGLVRSIGEMVKEIYQGLRQRARDVVPRTPRLGSYIALRALTNVIMRDLSTAMVAEQMMRGRKVVYVDFVDYDEIAHHAGPLRPESLQSLVGLDAVLATLEQVAHQAPRRYHFVVVSDHGQSQGATFRQRAGRGLADVVGELAGDAAPTTSTDAVETDGRAAGLVNELAGAGPARWFARAAQKHDRRRLDTSHGRVTTATGDTDTASTDTASTDPETANTTDTDVLVPTGDHDLVVVGSGNLGLVWFARRPGRLSAEEIDHLYPRLIARLAAHPAVGWVMVMTDSGAPVVMGRNGVRDLGSGEVEGADPLAGFDDCAAAELDRVARFANAPDLYVGSTYEPATMEVAAFEELVGSHGGLGGWQTEAILLHPSAWPIDEPVGPDGRLHGAEALHRQLVRWLEELGHRRQVVPERTASADRPVRSELTAQHEAPDRI